MGVVIIHFFVEGSEHSWGYPVLEKEKVGEDQEDLAGELFCLFLEKFLKAGVNPFSKILIPIIDKYFGYSVDSSRFVLTWKIMEVLSPPPDLLRHRAI